MPGKIFSKKVAALQAENNYPGVYDQAIKVYLQMGVDERCDDEDVDDLIRRIHKSKNKIKKAVMKINGSLTKPERKQFPDNLEFPEIFQPEETRRERKEENAMAQIIHNFG